MALPNGLEPLTLRLTAACSTDWAKEALFRKAWQIHILPGRFQPSTFCVYGLNFLVRNVSRCTPIAILTKHCYYSILFLSCLSLFSHRPSKLYSSLSNSRLKFRSISIGQLNTLLRVHPQPIQLLFSKLPLRILILKLVSRLDAFSGYLCQTWLPSCATGVTTGTSEVCPSRSSRTKDRSSQYSCAYSG